MTVAKSPAEQFKEHLVELTILKGRDAVHERDIDQLREELARERTEREHLREEVVKEREERIRLQLENAALKQQFQDHIAQYLERDRRQWQLFVLVVGAALSLATGLIVTLARK